MRVQGRRCLYRGPAMPYEVQTPVFEGPFDLLLHLILREQVDLYEISLARIVDVYIAELEKMDDLDLEVATEFLLIAATLVELKTKRLLPDDRDIDLDDEFALWEERDMLLARLLDCKTFKDAAKVLAALADEASHSYPRLVGLEDQFLDLAPDLLEGVTAEQMHAAFLRATAPKPVPTVSVAHLAEIRANVTDAVEELIDELPRVGRASFRELTASLVDRIDIVVRFLAVLELYKQGLIDIEQASSFGEIQVVWTAGADMQASDLDAIDVYDG
jgi:segregation and condensation protein A